MESGISAFSDPGELWTRPGKAQHARQPAVPGGLLGGGGSRWTRCRRSSERPSNGRFPTPGACHLRVQGQHEEPDQGDGQSRRLSQGNLLPKEQEAAKMPPTLPSPSPPPCEGSALIVALTAKTGAPEPKMYGSKISHLRVEEKTNLAHTPPCSHGLGCFCLT